THLVAVADRASLVHDPALDAAGKRVLFKRNVELVEVEPHAYCNRTCSFCPNSIIDRLTVTEHIDSNGDYLTSEALARLAAAGLSILRISVYMRRNVAWSPDAAREEIGRVGK